MKQCKIPFESLLEYHEGRAEANAAARLRAHLDTDCETCRESLDWLAKATPHLHAVQQVQVPEPLLNRARSLFRERNPVPARPAWKALLQFDSRSQLAWAGARGRAGAGFQLRYQTEQHDVILFQEPSERETWYVIGQVLPKEGDAIIIAQEVLLTAEDGERHTFTPQAEEFALPALPAGLYEITIRWEEGEIVLADVSVGRQENL